MATAEEATNPPAPAPAPVSILPQYPELILAAIEALDSKKGANKSRISRHIEASHGSLPAAHKTLLSHHLNKMRASGELVVIQNNYVRPDPNSPPRRGRGRPSKPKEPLPEGAVVSPPRPRGRPRKSVDGLAPVSSPASLTGRKRGRPAKSGGTPAIKPPSSGKGRGRPRKEGTGVGADMTSSSPATGEKKGRGRPRKVDSGGGGKGRGRPRKVAKTDADVTPVVSTGVKRGRGRPPKVVVTIAPAELD